MAAERVTGDEMKGVFKLNPVLHYIGIPIIGAALLFIHLGKTDGFLLFQWELLIIFGYVATVLDVKSKHIPNGLIIGMFAAWVVSMTAKLFLDTETALLLLKDAMFGFAIGGGLFFLVYFISRKGLGGGDVKFMAVSGLYLGFYNELSAMLYGTALAALIGLILLLLKKIGRKDTMPLVPFLYIGILIAIFYR